MPMCGMTSILEKENREILTSWLTHRESFDAQVSAFLWYTVHHSVFDVVDIEVEQCVSAIRLLT